MATSNSEDIRKQPALSLQDAELITRQHFGIEGTASLLPGERDQNFKIETGVGAYVLKIANPDVSRSVLELENQAIRLAEAADGFNSATLIKSTTGQTIVKVSREDELSFDVRCLSFVPGQSLATLATATDELLSAIGTALANLDNALSLLNRNPSAKRNLKWDLKNAADIVSSSNDLISDPKKRDLLQLFLQRYQNVAARIAKLPESVIYNDANDYNIMIHENDAGQLEVGIIDFGDLVYSSSINDLAICLAYVILGSSDPINVATTVVGAYHRARQISELELSVLFPLICMRLCQSVCISAEQQRLRPDDEYLAISETPAWAMLGRLAGIDPNEARKKFSLACRVAKSSDGDFGDAHMTVASILDSRQKFLSPSLSLAYERPLHIVRGKGQYLYDASDLTYLDCVNNVCHVGHCHPKVVDAATRQIGLLNTNTRFLHENIVRLAERLTATLPDPLGVCFFVNSGSEANDLALRLARMYTGNQDVVVVDHAYHGNLTTLIELSPYKFNRPGGHGKPDHVHVVPIPDVFRGEFKSDDCGLKYASAANGVIEEAVGSGRRIAAFFAESMLGCGGQIPLPAGYLEKIYSCIRQHGGICVADEVQVGFGRIGTHFWGFECQDVVPDIVTMGKPMGNGHPLAAVVTTREIADAFDNGMEYFNTFGGNPVSCSIGLAVLDVIEKQGLQQHALELGEWLTEHLGRLKDRYPVVGDVRGSGLFLGIELVLDPQTLQPATELARQIINRMRHHCILLSTDGPYDNVIKFKPPMVFEFADAERLVMMLDQVFAELT